MTAPKTPFAPSPAAPDMAFRVTREQVLEQRTGEPAPQGTVGGPELVINLPPFLARAKFRHDRERGYTILPSGAQGKMVRGDF